MNQYVLFLSFGCIFFTGHVQGMYWEGGEYDGFFDAVVTEQPVQSNEDKLWHAVVNDKIDTVKELLKMQGINLECQKTCDETVLHAAASEGNLAIVQLLLDKNANPNALDKFHDTPLCKAARAHSLYRCKNANFAKIVELLLRKGVEVNASNAWGYTPLHQAVYSASDLISEDMGLKVALCKQLLRAGADRHRQLKESSGDCVEYTPLHVAVGCNNLLAVQELIIFEPTQEELQHLVPGVWALEQLNFPKRVQEIIKCKLVALIVNDKVALAHAYMAMRASGKTAYDVAQDKKHAETAMLLETNVNSPFRLQMCLTIATRTEIATILDMNNEASSKALRLVVATRINELVKAPKNVAGDVVGPIMEKEPS